MPPGSRATLSLRSETDSAQPRLRPVCPNFRVPVSAPATYRLCGSISRAVSRERLNSLGAVGRSSRRIQTHVLDHVSMSFDPPDHPYQETVCLDLYQGNGVSI